MGLGDEFMVTGECRRLQERDPRQVRIVYEKSKWFAIWDHNPRIARREAKGDFQEYRPREGYRRPYIAEKSDTKWTWKAYGPPAGEIYFTEQELDFGQQHAGKVILEPSIKPGASPNKQWGREKWISLAKRLEANGFRTTLLGPIRPERLLENQEYIQTVNARLAAAVIAFSRALIIPDGGLHHVAAAVGMPAVVICGGFASPRVAGYEMHTNFFDGDDLGCGLRTPCNHCREAMNLITVDRVFDAAMKHLSADRKMPKQRKAVD
jgi:ADP-heptose:LPS heptosyltransferase